ncbi:GGDEF domain-containing protein [Qipengyuania marisflavi]|uniref:diguanylate cyclase n=1 Tax=Qipengyuania marisflavi TaxID=2486356 RepID=A0A5S3P636_9SPHN|nr:GGDEF domain-containing protein [Qipengyuania marisflavi]TMM48424.1 GGDEF domain-containing protein [Qipengyuania marisflavi]
MRADIDSTPDLPSAHARRMIALSLGAVLVPLVGFVLMEGVLRQWHWPLFLTLLTATLLGAIVAGFGLAGLVDPAAPGTSWLRLFAGGPRGTAPAAADAPPARASRAAVMHLKAAVNSDLLTGLYNRRGFYDELARRNSRGGTLAVLDGDRFTAINHQLGRAAGDRVLRAIAGRIADTIRPSDLAARWGGDEFVILFEAVARGDAEKIIRRIEASLLQHPVALLDGMAVSVNIGLAPCIDASDVVIEAAVKDAGEELYALKRQARAACA